MYKPAPLLYAMPYLLLTLSALFWSGNFALNRGIYAETPPVSLAFRHGTKGIRAVGINRAWPSINLMPVFGTIPAIVFLDEQLPIILRV